jgi:hypothetical protein
VQPSTCALPANRLREALQNTNTGKPVHLALKRWSGAAELLHVVSACGSSFPPIPKPATAPSPLSLREHRGSPSMRAVAGRERQHSAARGTPPCTPGPSGRPQASEQRLGPRHPDSSILTGHQGVPPPVNRQQCVSLPQLLPTAVRVRELQRPGWQRGGPTCTRAHCDVRSGCIALTSWRRASQCHPHDRLALFTTHVR